MAVKIVPKFTKQDIAKLLQDRRKRILKALTTDWKRIGEQFVIHARTNAGFKDRTGNLRSSIGYVILYNGLQITENFETLKGKEGESIARKLVDEIATEFPRGLVLICVAGMEYAAAVESKGFDVITNSATFAEESLKKSIKIFQEKLKKTP